jgi:hypothetical protein
LKTELEMTVEAYFSWNAGIYRRPHRAARHACILPGEL